MLCSSKTGMMPTETDDSYLPTRSFLRFLPTRGLRSIRSLIVLVCLVAALPVRPAAASARPTAPDALPLVPPNLQASVPILQLMARMAQLSPTFRAQCERITETRNLIVRIRYVGLREDRPYNARTIVRRHQWGAMVAEVELYVPLDPIEILAHELEHLVEQIQGQDLRVLAQVKGSGVMEVRRGEFETMRAIEVGRRVLAECGRTERGSATLEPTAGM
jgi:hypothetical protein